MGRHTYCFTRGEGGTSQDFRCTRKTLTITCQYNISLFDIIKLNNYVNKNINNFTQFLYGKRTVIKYMLM